MEIYEDNSYVSSTQREVDAFSDTDLKKKEGSVYQSSDEENDQSQKQIDDIDASFDQQKLIAIIDKVWTKNNGKLAMSMTK